MMLLQVTLQGLTRRAAEAASSVERETKAPTVNSGAVLPPAGQIKIDDGPVSPSFASMVRGAAENLNNFLSGLNGESATFPPPREVPSESRGIVLGEKFQSMKQIDPPSSAEGNALPDGAPRAWNPKIGGLPDTHEIDGKSYDIRVVHGNGNRPDVVYAPPALIHKLSERNLIAHGTSAEEAAELSKQTKAFVAKQEDGSSVMVLPLPEGGTREERVRWGAMIRHEWEHTKGNGEGLAHKEQSDYEKRLGVEPGLKSREDILRKIGSTYDEAEFIKAAAELAKGVGKTVGERIDFLQDVMTGSPSDRAFVKATIAAFGSFIDEATKVAKRSMNEYQFKNEFTPILKEEQAAGAANGPKYDTDMGGGTKFQEMRGDERRVPGGKTNEEVLDKSPGAEKSGGKLTAAGMAADVWNRYLGIDSMPEALKAQLPIYRVTDREHMNGPGQGGDTYFSIGTSGRAAWGNIEDFKGKVVIRTTYGELERIAAESGTSLNVNPREGKISVRSRVLDGGNFSEGRNFVVVKETPGREEW